MPERIVRVWYTDKTFVDVPESQVWEFQDDPSFDCVESLDDIAEDPPAPYGDDQ